MSIDPATCGPDDAYVVRLPHRGRTHIAQRINPNGEYSWRAIIEAGDLFDSTRYTDSQVTVLHRLDVPMQPWDVLEEAADLMHPKSHPTGLWTPEERALRDEAKRLEREHRAAKEKAEQDAARESLIEKANVRLRGLGDYDTICMLADSGLLAEAVQS